MPRDPSSAFKKHACPQYRTFSWGPSLRHPDTVGHFDSHSFYSGISPTAKIGEEWTQYSWLEVRREEPTASLRVPGSGSLGLGPEAESHPRGVRSLEMKGLPGTSQDRVTQTALAWKLFARRLATAWGDRNGGTWECKESDTVMGFRRASSGCPETLETARSVPCQVPPLQSPHPMIRSPVQSLLMTCLSNLCWHFAWLLKSCADKWGALSEGGAVNDPYFLHCHTSQVYLVVRSAVSRLPSQIEASADSGGPRPDLGGAGGGDPSSTAPSCFCCFFIRPS